MTIRLATLFCAALAAASAQPSPEILAVTQWRLNFNVTSSTNGSVTDLTGTYTWDFHAVAAGSAILTPGGGKLVYQGLTKIQVSGGYTSKWVLPGGYCSYETNTSFSAVPEHSDTLMAYVSMIRKDGFQISLGPDTIKYPTVTTELCRGVSNVTNSMESFSWTPVWVEPIPYPATGAFLTGSLKMQDQIITGQIPSINDGDFQLNFTMVPDIKEDLTLNVESSGYQKWRPSANLDGSAGDPLALTATLVSSTGNNPNTRIDRMTWELKNCSKEPGIALNWPLNATDSEYDLKLDPSGPPSTYDDTRQKVERFVVQGFTDSINVLPYDWGAWADLEVTALLTDGRSVTGKFKPGGDSPIRVPRRAADSHIADAWKDVLSGKGIKVGADDADDEATPAGDGTPGDGLTLYEEYRGFYENGTHIEGDPTKKDFFLVDQTGGLAAGGIAKLQRIVKLAVHGNLAPGELPDDRVINKNTKQGAHVVAQHGVVLAVDGALSGVAEARGGPSNPKRISLVALPSDTGAWEPSYMAASVAHELLHAINVWHHGDSDREATWRVGTDGVLREFYLLGPSEGIVIKVLTETGIDVTAILARSMGASGAPVWVGMKQGQHSGFENCVMRYDNANAYVSDADPTVRYFVTELTGHALCDSISGTSVNAPGRTPQSRYGVAQVGRGICLQQILVTDAIVAPKR